MTSPEEKFEYGDKYSFIAVWYNEIAEVEKPFLLSFFPQDGSIELYDLKCSRLFLRRTKVEGISLQSLHKGSTVTIFCRQMKIEEYANAWTQNIFEVALQKIFSIVKPHALEKIGEIISHLERRQFKISNLKMGVMTRDAVLEILSKETSEGPPPTDLVESFTEGPSVAIEAIGERGLSKWAEVVGPDDPEIAQQEAPDSLRAVLGISGRKNAMYNSVNLRDQSKDATVWFPDYKPKERFIKSCARLTDSTCCIIKPHAVQEGIAGNILSFLTKNGFQITALEMFHLERSAAEEFYEVYKGVVPEYSSIVTQLCSGSCIALELSHIGDPASSPRIFRELAGHNDPLVAQRIHPDSIRAKFGISTVLNAVHCTDLPEDAKLEVEFFFKLLQLK